MYATGLGYRADKVTRHDAVPGDDLGDRETRRRKIFVLDDFQEAIGMANLVNGYPLNETDDDELEKSQRLADRPEAEAARLSRPTRSRT